MTSDYLKSSLWGQRVGGDAAAQDIPLLRVQQSPPPRGTRPPDRELRRRATSSLRRALH